MKKAMILLLSVCVLIILAGIAFGANILVVASDDNDFNVLSFLGGFYAEKGDFENAVSAYEQSLLVAENEPDRNNLAVIYHNSGCYAKAIEHLRVLVDLDPDNLNYQFDLAINLVDRFRKADGRQLAGLHEALDIYESLAEKGFPYAAENAEVLVKVLSEA